jgi:hypothetical protein
MIYCCKQDYVCEVTSWNDQQLGSGLDGHNFIKLSSRAEYFHCFFFRNYYCFSWWLLTLRVKFDEDIVVYLLLPQFFISSPSYNYSFPSSFLLPPVLSFKLKQLRHLRYSILHLLHLLVFNLFFLPHHSYGQVIVTTQRFRLEI